MKKTILILIAVLILTASGSSQWVHLTQPGNVNINAIEAVTGSIVYAVGYGIWKTNNSGTNWTKVLNVEYEEIQSDAFFYSVSTGWTCGKNGTVYKTTNGGENWVQRTAGSENLSGVDFINSSTGYVCGAIGRLYKTTNGGDNWTALNPGTTGYLHSILFLNDNTGFVTGYGSDNKGIIIKTTNKGMSWFEVFGGVQNGISDIDFVGNNMGYACGYRKVFRTTDGGTTWDTTAVIHRDNLSSMHSIEMLNNEIGFMTGSLISGTYVFKTYDGGANWYAQWGDVSNSLNDITVAPLSTTEAWIGHNKGVEYTTNGGGNLIGIQPVSNEVPSGFELSQNYPNPFNPVTNINFSVHKAGNVKLVVFDAAGKEVAELVNNQLSAGTYNYDFDASHLASGVYFYKLTGGDFSEVKKMMLIK